MKRKIIPYVLAFILVGLIPNNVSDGGVTFVTAVRSTA